MRLRRSRYIRTYTFVPYTKLFRSVLGLADHALFTVDIQLLPALRLAEGDLGWHATGCGAIEGAHVFAVGAADVPARKRVSQRGAMNGRQREIGRAHV